MKRKRILFDPGFWMLVGINIYLVYYYYHHPEIYTTLIWLYWAQSVLLGLVNFVDMITTRDPIRLPKDQVNVANALKSKLNDWTVNADGKPKRWSNVGISFFFLVHYGFFHLVYIIFIAGMKRTGPFQWEFFKYFLLAFFVGQVFSFVQHKVRQRTQPTNMGGMFFLPYLRIIPMHLTILLPRFLGLSDLGVFLVLKAIADVVMYIATKPARSSKEMDAAMLASQQTLHM